MGKGSGIILGLIALLISAGVGGYVLYNNFIATPPSTGNQWYASGIAAEFMNPSEAWDTSNFRTIDFTVVSGQTVYISYVGQVLLDDTSGDSYVEIKFSVDGVRWYSPSLRIWRYNTVSPGGIRLSVALQHYNTTMPSGSHTLTIAFRGDSTSDALYVSWSLFVQTFN